MNSKRNDDQEHNTHIHKVILNIKMFQIQKKQQIDSSFSNHWID